MAIDGKTIPLSREAYEGIKGGWNDGRLGQVYDLLYNVLRDMGERPFGHPILASIEALDAEIQK